MGFGGVGFGVWGVWCGVRGVGCGMWGVWGMGFGVWDMRFWMGLRAWIELGSLWARCGAHHGVYRVPDDTHICEAAHVLREE